MEDKILKRYNMTRVVSRTKQEIGEIKRGEEEFYNPQLNYLEHAIYQIHEKLPISDNELREVIEVIICKIKGIIDNIFYDPKELITKEQFEFIIKLEYTFNPLMNDNIKENLRNQDLEDKEYLKELFKLPILCLMRIYDSIEFWRKHSGINGYYKMLEEYVLPIFTISENLFILEDGYIKENPEINLENLPHIKLHLKE